MGKRRKAFRYRELRVAALLCLTVWASCTEPPDGGQVLQSGPGTQEPVSEFTPMQAIVKRRPSAKAELRSSLGELRSAPLMAELEVVTLTRVDAAALGGERAATLALIKELKAQPEVEYAHPNWRFSLSAVPSDPLYSRQWSAPLIRLPAAWDVTRGSSFVRIAILDTGRSSHIELDSKWAPNLEYDAAMQDGDATQEYGSECESGRQEGSCVAWAHGVAVAGVAAGASGNGQGIAGVCQECQLLNVKVADVEGKPSLDAVIRGIGWSVDNGAQVVNLSLEVNTGLACSDPSMRAIHDVAVWARDRNVVLVAAAGNQGIDAASVVPASCPGVISVAASDRSNRLADYSNRGAVTLTAPGGGASLDSTQQPPNIGPEGRGAGVGCPPDDKSFFGPSESGVFSTWATSQRVPCYRYLSGTSLASPHVAGVVGLMLSRNPNLTPGQVRTLLQATAQPMPGCGGQCGAGLLDAEAAVRQAAPLPIADSPPAATFTSSCAGLYCTFDASSSSDDRGITSYQWRFPGQQLRRGAVVQFFMPSYLPLDVELRVVDGSGQSATTWQRIRRSQPVVAPVRGSWHDPQRPGSTLDLFHNDLGEWFVTWYTFQADGAPVWYVSDPVTVFRASWNSALYRATWTGTGATLTTVGSLSLSFSSATEAWLSWQLDGRSGGERVIYRGGGNGKSGTWFAPQEPGWGLSLQEIGGSLEATYSIYEGANPRWVRGTTANGASVNLQLIGNLGIGLCPGCGGSALPNDAPLRGSASVQVPSGLSTNGTTSVDVSVHRSIPYRIWQRSAAPISRLSSR